jgi:hypothetical protein
MKLKKLVEHGDEMPPWYGVAWYEFSRDAAVCLPVPLNLVAGLLRSLWAFLRFGYRPTRLNARDAFMQGYWLGRTDRDQPPEWRRL